jgi:predicted TIM-barrel fold metal-dependent hydrolase
MSGPLQGGWDCHAHVFGPYARYPLAPNPSHTPPEATAGAYLALLARLGLSHGVLVHPSAYGDDPALLLDTLAEHPRLRGVVVARRGGLERLDGLRDRGVRAARFSHRSAGNFAASASFDDLRHFAPALAEAGLHAELWTDCQALPAIAAELRRLPVPVVIDHMGGFDWRAGTDDPGFRALLALLADGTVWVKLCAYRNLLAAPDPEIGRAFHARLLQANPSRLVWGSDWPHLRVEPFPDALDLLTQMKAWTGDDDLTQRILVDNPSRLYG